MKIKAIKDYYDLKLNKTVKAGDEYEVSNERGLELTTKNNKSGTILAEAIESPTPTEKVAKPAAKKKVSK